MSETVSVVICAYNYGRFLGECLESVLRQTHPPGEIIVVDDGSEDETAEVVRRFEGVRYLRQVRAGTAAAFNRGFAAATGEIVCYLDADDYWMPKKLERVLMVLGANPSAGGAVHEVLPVSGEGTRLNTELPSQGATHACLLTLDDLEDVGFLYPLPRARGRWFGVPHTACVRRAAAEDLFPLPHSTQGGVDGILVAAAVRHGILCIPEALSAYRIHGRNWELLDPSGSNRDTIRMWEYLLGKESFRRFLSKSHASLLRAKILERKGYLASRTGKDIFAGAWASAQVPLILLRNGLLCNWKHLALPLACVLPVKRERRKAVVEDGDRRVRTGNKSGLRRR